MTSKLISIHDMVTTCYVISVIMACMITTWLCHNYVKLLSWLWRDYVMIMVCLGHAMSWLWHNCHVISWLWHFMSWLWRDYIMIISWLYFMNMMRLLRDYFMSMAWLERVTSWLWSDYVILYHDWNVLCLDYDLRQDKYML